MLEIIKGAIDRRTQQGKPVTYHRVSGYESLDYYVDKIRSIAHDPTNRDRSFIKSGELDANSYFLGYLPGTLANSLDGGAFFPERVQQIWNMSHVPFDSPLSLLKAENGFLQRIVSVLGSKSRILIKAGDSSNFEEYSQALDFWQAHREEITGLVRMYLQDAITHIETVVSQNNHPVSAAEVFSYFLEKNQGQIDQSLFDAAIFFKYMARNDLTVQSFSHVGYMSNLYSANETWFQTNIVDEYGRVGNYSQLPYQTFRYNGLLSTRPGLADTGEDKDLHLINQIGKPYHAWNIVALLAAAPPAVCQIGVAWRQYWSFSEQGPVKTAADFRVALETNNIDSLLMMYSQ